ncbi:MAG: hypothetical protein KIT39_15770, partial [Nitrospirales bacterium]|nr:hypothetical protein [Nitrospirales bacterium]
IYTPFEDTSLGIANRTSSRGPGSSFPVSALRLPNMTMPIYTPLILAKKTQGGRETSYSAQILLQAVHHLKTISS